MRLWQRGIRGRLLHYILNSGAMRYKRFVDVPGSTERVYFTDERGISTGHVLSPLLFLIEQDDMGAYLADDEHPGVHTRDAASGCGALRGPGGEARTELRTSGWAQGAKGRAK